MLLIILVGSGLRLYGLEIQSLWTDELVSWSCSRANSIGQVIHRVIADDAHPPGYHLILYVFIKLFGDSPTVLRLPSALAGIGSILMVFLLGRRVYSATEGLIAAGWVAILPFPLFYSQEARPYSLLMLSTVMATYFWWEIITGYHRELPVTRWKSTAYILTAVITFYLCYYGALIILLQALGTICLFRSTIRAKTGLVLTYGLIFAAFLPWIPAFIAQTADVGIGWIQYPRPVKYVLAYLPQGVDLLMIPGGMVFIWLAIRKLKTSGRSDGAMSPVDPDIFLFLWLTMPFAVALTISVLFQPIFVLRHLIISIPAAYLLLARLVNTRFRRPVRRIFLFSLYAVFTCYLFSPLAFYQRPLKYQFREAVNFVVHHQDSASDTPLLGYVYTSDMLEYYFQQRGTARKLAFNGGKTSDIPRMQSFLDRHHPETWWYIWAHRVPDQEFLNFIKRNYRVSMDAQFYGAGVWLLKKRNDSPLQ